MTGHRGTIGLCLLCALAFSAFAAQSASAAEAGTTAFTCKKTTVGVGEKFNNAHCRDKLADESTGTSPTGEYRHVEIKEKTPTQISGSNNLTGTSKEPAKFQTTQSGINVVIDAETVSGTGTMENRVNETTKEHFIDGKGKIEYTELKVTPEELKCVVKGGKVTTKELTASSEGLAMGAGKKMHLKFVPVTPEVFAEFELEKCTQEALNGIYKVTGSVTTNEIDGATITTTGSVVEGEGTLKTRSKAAGISGSLTISGKDEAAGDTEYTPLSSTTVST